MRRIVLPLMLLVGVITVPSQSNAAPAAGSRTYLVQFTSNFKGSDQAALARSMGFGITKQFNAALNGFAAELNDGQVRALEKNPNVEFVEAEATMTADEITSTPINSTQTPAIWGLDRIDQRPLPLSTTFSFWNEAGKGVNVYVFDTGFRSPSLTEFASVGLGRNFVSDQAATNTNDCNGHGTHVSGTIASLSYGVAKAATIIPVRVLGCTGSGTSTALVSAIDWVISQQAGALAVGNMSLGFGVNVKGVNTAVANLVNAGVQVVAAAGNGNTNACNSSPGSVPSAVTVGATDSSDTRASFSNFGKCLDLFAPGVGITSFTYNGNTAVMSGTSMAAPHVVGILALLQSHNSYTSASKMAADLVQLATSNAVRSVGTGSPNRLAFVPSN